MAKQAAQQFVEQYLYRARGFRALEDSVLAQGGRLGLSERALRAAARRLNLIVRDGMWQLSPEHAHALTQTELLELERVAPVEPVRPQQPARR